MRKKKEILVKFYCTQFVLQINGLIQRKPKNKMSGCFGERNEITSRYSEFENVAVTYYCISPITAKTFYVLLTQQILFA